jgi:hypothetical protein
MPALIPKCPLHCQLHTMPHLHADSQARLAGCNVHAAQLHQDKERVSARGVVGAPAPYHPTTIALAHQAVLLTH